MAPLPCALSRRQLLRWPLAGLGAPSTVTALAALAPLAACSPREPLRVGFIGGLSGRIADLGIGARNGTQMAVDDVNAAGGIGGRRLELLAHDDEQHAEVARQRLSELFDAGVVCVVGPLTSQMAVALLPLAEARGVPLVSPLAGAAELAGRDDVFFRVISNVDDSARQHGSALYRRGLRRIVTVADLRNAVFSRVWSRALAAQFTAAGGTVLEAIEFEAAPGLHFVDLAQRIAATGADGVALAASAADSAVLVQQVRRLRPGLAVGLSAWAGTEELPQLGGPALDGVLVTQFFDRFSGAPRWLDFVARYRERYGDAPGYPALNGYDALQLAAQGLKGADARGLRAALREVRSLNGLQRPLQFDLFGDALAPTYLTEVRGGRYVAVPA